MTKISDFAAGRTPGELYETYLVPAIFIPFSAEIVPFARAGGKVLDMACGTGIVSREMHRVLDGAISTTGLDVGPAMLACARAALPESETVRWIEASALDMPLPDDSFDLVVCQQGLQFMPDRAQALSEVRRVLKPGGQFVAAVWASPEFNPDFSQFDQAIGTYFGADLVPSAPFGFGDQAALGALVEEAGFAIEQIDQRSKQVVLPGLEDFVLFDLMFLGRPGADGAMQPVVAPDDQSADAVIERLIAELEPAMVDPAHPDRMEITMTTNFVVARAI